jgi:hypothetical protein
MATHRHAQKINNQTDSDKKRCPIRCNLGQTEEKDNNARAHAKSEQSVDDSGALRQKGRSMEDDDDDDGGCGEAKSESHDRQRSQGASL